MWWNMLSHIIFSVPYACCHFYERLHFVHISFHAFRRYTSMARTTYACCTNSLLSGSLILSRVSRLLRLTYENRNYENRLTLLRQISISSDGILLPKQSHESHYSLTFVVRYRRLMIIWWSHEVFRCTIDARNFENVKHVQNSTTNY